VVPKFVQMTVKYANVPLRYGKITWPSVPRIFDLAWFEFAPWLMMNDAPASLRI